MEILITVQAMDKVVLLHHRWVQVTLLPVSMQVIQDTLIKVHTTNRHHLPLKQHKVSSGIRLHLKTLLMVLRQRRLFLLDHHRHKVLPILDMVAMVSTVMEVKALDTVLLVWVMVDRLLDMDLLDKDNLLHQVNPYRGPGTLVDIQDQEIIHLGLVHSPCLRPLSNNIQDILELPAILMGHNRFQGIRDIRHRPRAALCYLN